MIPRHSTKNALRLHPPADQRPAPAPALLLSALPAKGSVKRRTRRASCQRVDTSDVAWGAGSRPKDEPASIRGWPTLHCNCINCSSRPAQHQRSVTPLRRTSCHLVFLSVTCSALPPSLSNSQLVSVLSARRSAAHRGSPSRLCGSVSLAATNVTSSHPSNILTFGPLTTLYIAFIKKSMHVLREYLHRHWRICANVRRLHLEEANQRAV